MAELEALEAIATFSFLTNNIEDRINQFSTFSVVTLGPVVTGTSLTEDEVIRAEKLTEGTGTDGIHGTGFKINKDGTGDVFATSSFVEVNIDTFELKFGFTVVGTGGINTVFIRDNFPELSTNLVTRNS